MQNLTPTRLPVPDFTPVPRRYRYDGWTPERQRAFIAALAETGSVKAACRRINMSPEGAYYLRRQNAADSFRAAWDAALSHGVQNLADIAIEIDQIQAPRIKEAVPPVAQHIEHHRPRCPGSHVGRHGCLLPSLDSVPLSM